MTARARVTVTVIALLVFIVAISAAGYMILGSEAKHESTAALDATTSPSQNPSPIRQEAIEPSKPLPYSALLKPRISAQDDTISANSLYSKPLPIPQKDGALGEAIRSLVTCLRPFRKYFNKPAANSTVERATFYLNLRGWQVKGGC